LAQSIAEMFLITQPAKLYDGRGEEELDIVETSLSYGVMLTPKYDKGLSSATLLIFCEYEKKPIFH